MAGKLVRMSQASPARRPEAERISPVLQSSSSGCPRPSPVTRMRTSGKASVRSRTSGSSSLRPKWSCPVLQTNRYQASRSSRRQYRAGPIWRPLSSVIETRRATGSTAATSLAPLSGVRTHSAANMIASDEIAASTHCGEVPAKTTRPPALRNLRSNSSVVRRMVSIGGTTTARYSALPTHRVGWPPFLATRLWRARMSSSP